MAQQAGKFRVTTLCGVFRVSRSGYYRWCRGPESRRAGEDRKLRVEVRAVFRRSHGRYGSPRVYRELRQQGVPCGQHRVARLMKEEGLQARRDRRFKVTTRSVSGRRVASNRLNQEFSVSRPDTVWAGDITYLWTREGWLYLAVLLDLCSRRVVGWSCSDRLTTPLVGSALEEALRQRRPAPGLLHHSDQGGQYTSIDYQAELAARSVEVSMSRRGNCYDNAVVESFFSTLKAELDGYGQYETREQAQTELFEYIEVFYNRQRQHSSLGYRSPAEFERAQEERNEESQRLGTVPSPAVHS
jgi:putative transposase